MSLASAFGASLLQNSLDIEMLSIVLRRGLHASYSTFVLKHEVVYADNLLKGQLKPSCSSFIRAVLSFSL